MKTKTGFHLRDICGEYVIVAEGVENIDFSKCMPIASAVLKEPTFVYLQYE